MSLLKKSKSKSLLRFNLISNLIHTKINIVKSIALKENYIINIIKNKPKFESISNLHVLLYECMYALIDPKKVNSKFVYKMRSL